MGLVKQYKGLVAAVAALAVVGALWAGVSASTLLILVLVLACPLMMLTMHGGGGHGGHGRREREAGRNPRHDAYGDDGSDPDRAVETNPHAAHRHPTDTRPW